MRGSFKRGCFKGTFRDCKGMYRGFEGFGSRSLNGGSYKEPL